MSASIDKDELRDAQNAWVKHGKIEQDVDYFVDRITELDHQIQLLKEGKWEIDELQLYNNRR